jgi:MYXO-CTERM domain-containing protein
MAASLSMAYLSSMRFAACSLLFSAFLAMAPTAHADAVPPPPRNCPNGSAGETGHIGAYCRPLSCANDSECAVYGPEFSCQPVALCIQIIEYTDWNGQVYEIETVTGECSLEATCPPNAKCDESPKCATGAGTSSASSTAASTGASGASTGSSASGTGASGAGGETSDGDEPDRRIEGCGCAVPGQRSRSAGALLAGLALMVGAGMRRRRRAG